MRLRWLVIALLVVLGIVVILAKVYLASSRVASEVASHLQSILGVPVQVAKADVGLRGDSELHNVQIFEPTSSKVSTSEQPPSDEPWLRIGHVDANLSVLDLLTGSSKPSRVRLRGVSITLRFDKNDHLLTRLPSFQTTTKGNLPTILIDDGNLTIDQEGRKPMVIEGIQGALVPDSGGLKVGGTIDDSFWGPWVVGGQINPTAVTLTLDTAKAVVDAQKLNKLPFISPVVWKQVMVEGMTSVHLAFDFSFAPTGSSHYRVELTPIENRVHISSIDLDASNASGKVIVEDGLVTLTDGHGHTAGGTFDVNGTLDFRPTPSVLKLNVSAQNVRLRDLPRSWDLPEQLDGKLSGDAKLRLVLSEPEIRTEGSTGEGIVKDVTLLGLGKPGTGTAKLYLHAGPGRFSFRQEPSAKKTAVPLKKTAAPLAATMVAFQPTQSQPGASPEPSTDEDWFLSHALGLVPHTVGILSNKLTAGIATGMHWLNHLDQPPPPGKTPTYFEVNLSLQDVDLAKLIRRAKLALPFAVAGKLSFRLNISFPVDTPRDFKTYRFQGDAQLSRLNLAGFEMTNVRAHVRYADSLLLLESVQGETPAPGAASGSFQGTARYQVIPSGNLTATLHLEQVALDAVLGRLPAIQQAKGSLSGNVRFQAPGERLRDPASWEAAGVLHSRLINAYGATLKDISATITMTDGMAAVKDLKGDLEGASLTGSGSLRLVGDYSYAANLAANGVDLAFVQRLQPSFRSPVAVKGRLDMTTDLKGTLHPWKMAATGTSRTANLTIETARVNTLSFQYNFTPDRLEVTDLKAGLYQGTVSGSAKLPLEPAATGDVSLRIKDVDAKALSQGVPAFPVRLEGQVSGTVSGKLLAKAPDKPRAITSNVELAAPNLRLQGVPTERVRGTIDYRAGRGSYRLEGEVAGGTFNVEGDLSPQAAPPSNGPAPETPPAGSQKGSLKLRDVHIDRLVESLFPRRGLSPLRGTLNVNLPFRLEASDQRPVGQGTFTLSNVRWSVNSLADRLQGNLFLRADGIHISDVSGSLGGGDLRLRAGYRFQGNEGSYFNLRLFHVDAASLLLPFPELAGKVDGPLDVNLRLSGVRELHGSMRAVLTQGKVLGVEVVDWQLPIDFNFIPGDGGQLEVRDSSVQIAGGHASGRASLRWGNSIHLEGNVRFAEAELRNIAGRNSEVSSFASGRLTGQLDFNADDLQSINDLKATLAMKLSQTQAMGLPILRQIIPFIGLVGGGEWTRFQSGEVRGSLAHGIFRFQRFTLTSDLLRLILEGDVTLAGGLNLSVTAGSAGFNFNSPGLRLLGLRVPAVGALPLALIVDTSAFLANQVVHLRINGTFQNPVVRVEPTGLLTEEAVRFFLVFPFLP